MAYMNQEMKAKIAARIKPLLKEYGVKGTLSVRNRSAIVLTLSAGKIDFIGNFTTVCRNKPGFRENTSGYCSVTQYEAGNCYAGTAKNFLVAAMHYLHGADWYDCSNVMVDYHDTAYYVELQIGQWDKPYKVLG